MTNVTRYGTRGDGLADDSAALQQALDTGDGAVYVPPGNYRLSRPLQIRLDRTRFALSGAGGCARLIMAAPGPALRLAGTHRRTASPKDTVGDVADRERMPTVDALEIVGEHPEADGIEIAYTWQPTLTRLTIQRCRHGVHVVENNRNLLVNECHIYNNSGVGIFLDQVGLHQVNILGSHISYNKGGGIKVWHSEIRNLQIAGNDIEYNYDPEAEVSADVWLETGERSIREGAITGNTIQALPSRGGANIRLVGRSATVGHKVGLFSIAGNLISSQETNLYLRWARGVAITGNTFFSGHSHSIHAVQSSNLVVGSCLFDHNPDYARETLDGLLFEECTGCTLSGLHLADVLAGTPEEGGGIEFRSCRSVALTGCQIFNPRYRGIVLRNCQHVRIAACLIVCDKSRPTLREAIQIIHSEDCQIVGSEAVLASLPKEEGT